MSLIHENPTQELHGQDEERTENALLNAEIEANEASEEKPTENGIGDANANTEVSTQNLPFQVDLNHSDPEKRCSAENALKDPPKQSWLLRLFEAKLFDMSFAITYLYNSKESGQ